MQRIFVLSAAQKERATAKPAATRGSDPGRGRKLAVGLAQCAAAAVLAAWLGGCAVTQPVTPARFDFGDPGARAVSENQGAAAHAPVVVPDVTAPSDLDSDQIRYRLGYLNGQLARGYAASRWTMTPAQLVTQRLRARLARQGAVLSNSGTTSATVLRVELNQFEQVFDQPNVGRGVVSLRATLTRNGALVAQREFFSDAAARTPDAAGGAQALAQASDAAITALIAWFQAQAQP